MPRFLLKLGERYCEWSTICDAAITVPMTMDELHDYIKEEYGREGLDRLPERLKDLEESGGASSGETAEEAITCNRMGKGESELSFKQILDWAEKDFEGEPPVGEVVRDEDEG